MNRKKSRIVLLLMILLLQSFILRDSSEIVFAETQKDDTAKAVKEEEIRLPALIQTTTLESDYKALTSLGLAFTSLSPQGDPAQAYENILRSCVRIQVEGHYGSGSIYKMLENEIIIVTNRHVLQYWNEDSYVTFFDGAVTGGVLLGVSKEADLGFISIPVADFSYQELLDYRNVRIAVDLFSDQWNIADTKAISEGSRVFFVDMASDWRTPVKKEGEVTDPLLYLDDFQMEMLYGTGDVVPGMSGCGVFDDFGYYVGMLTGGTLQGEIAAVPVEVIAKEYEKYINE